MPSKESELLLTNLVAEGGLEPSTLRASKYFFVFARSLENADEYCVFREDAFSIFFNFFSI